MKNLQIIWKMASAGDRTAQQKLMSGAEQEIRFLCTALCPDSIIREKAFGESMNIISSGISGCGSLDEFTFLVRKKTAEICMRNTGERIVPDDIPQQDISLSGNMDMISLPSEVLRDYYAVNEAMQMIYYSTRGYEYHIFVLRYFAGFTIKDAAEMYHISESDAQKILVNTIAGIRHSLETFRPDEKKTELSFSSLLDSASALRPPAEKRDGALRRTEQFFKTPAGKTAASGVFALILTAVCAAIFIPIVNSPGKDQTESRYIHHGDFDYDNNYDNHDIVRKTDDTEINGSLYIDLVCDEVCEGSVLGINTAGFVQDSGQVTVFQLIVTNSTSDMINTTDLQATLSDGRENYYENGKRYFTYNVFEIDERTYLMEIFAPGSYSPDDFRIDMYRNGIPDSSYDLPAKIKSPDDIRSDLIADNSSALNAPQHSIIRVFENGKAHYYYISTAYVQITEQTDEEVTQEAVLLLIPVGGITGSDARDSFEYVSDPDALNKHSDIINNVTIERTNQHQYDLPEYISAVIFRINAELKAGNADIDEIKNALNGYFSYKNDTIRIEPICF